VASSGQVCGRLAMLSVQGIYPLECSLNMKVGYRGRCILKCKLIFLLISILGRVLRVAKTSASFKGRGTSQFIAECKDIANGAKREMYLSFAKHFR
jgi:hypothetical protein